VKNVDLIKYQTFANALIKLNNATNILLKNGANEQALRHIIKGTNMLFEELSELVKTLNPDALGNGVDVEFEEQKPRPVEVKSREQKRQRT
jgi:hypothetical protein